MHAFLHDEAFASQRLDESFPLQLAIGLRGGEWIDVVDLRKPAHRRQHLPLRVGAIEDAGDHLIHQLPVDGVFVLPLVRALLHGRLD